VSLGASLGACLAAGLAVTGCGAAGGADPPASPPPGVWVSLHQFRVDQVARRILVGLHNNGPGSIYVKDLRLESGSFTPTPPIKVEQAFAPTPRVDLPITFGTARCDPNAVPAVRPSAVIARIRGGDGSVRPVRLRLPHPEPLLSQILTAECGTFIVRQAVDVRLGDTWTPAKVAGEDVLRGALVLRRTGRGRQVTITGMGANPHYNIRPANVKLPFVVPRGTGDHMLAVDITPARCDAHAFAEAKYAHRYSLFAEVGDGRRYSVPFDSTGRTRAAIDDFARTVCDLPPPG